MLSCDGKVNGQGGHTTELVRQLAGTASLRNVLEPDDHFSPTAEDKAVAEYINAAATEREHIFKNAKNSHKWAQ